MELGMFRIIHEVRWTLEDVQGLELNVDGTRAQGLDMS
jgi:hypothetical protein